MNKLVRSLIIGGLTTVGLAAIGYRAYEIKKLQNALKEEEIIEIEPVEETKNA